MIIIISLTIILIVYLYMTYYQEPFEINYQVIPRKCFSPKINLRERGLFLKLISIVNKILTKYNIDWIPIGGNLLAVYRYKTLILPWDDDFDFVVEKKKNIFALEVLKNELPTYGCKIVFIKRWLSNNCFLYKIFFVDKKNYSRKNYNFNWPFLDFFVNNQIDSRDSIKNPLVFRKSNMPNDLTLSEYPLIKLKCDGIDIKVPSNGFRSYKEMKKTNSIDVCYDDSLYHSNITRNTCKGVNLKKCSELPFKIEDKSIFDNIS